MKTKSIIVLTIILATLTSSSNCAGMGKGIKPSKNYITRDFKVGDFDKLDISAVANIYFTQSADGSTSLQIYGSDNLVELMKVDVKDNTLFLSMKKDNINNGDLKVMISSPDLQYVKIRGVGNFKIEDKLETTSLSIKYEGVGNMKINNIVCTELNLRSEGVGNISVGGKAVKATLRAEGIGSIDADELESESVTASSEGIGNISCYASQSIDAKVNGIGGISYKGNPSEKKLKKNGIGSIRQK